jgi:pentalenene oxygenase
VRLGRDPLSFMDSLREHCDLVEIKLGPLSFVVVCDPRLAHQVRTDLRTFDHIGPVYDPIRRALGSGVATAAFLHRPRRARFRRSAAGRSPPTAAISPRFDNGGRRCRT